MMVIKIFLSFSFLLLLAWSAAQDTWDVQGSAFMDGERIVLTRDEPDQGGAAWSADTINLNENFTLEFPIYLGADGGADGLAFVLTTSPEYKGATGGTLGVEGIQPSLSVNIYTFSKANDPAEHITIRVDAPGNHPEVPLYRLPNLTDGQEHLMRISWTAPARLLRVYVGNDLSRPRILYFLPESVFVEEDRVHYGFTAATGDLHNLHYFVDKDIE